MTVAIALVSALLVVGLTVSDAMRRSQRREQLLRSDPLGLIGPEPGRSPHLSAAALLSGLVGLLVVYPLAGPHAAGLLKSRLNALGLALAASVCAVYLLVQFHLLWREGSNGDGWHGSAQRTRGEGLLGPRRCLATLAFLLLTVAPCALATILVSREPYAFVARIHVARLFVLAVMTAFWTWLARVWEQQLDAGRAWTTAGRLIPLARATSLFAALWGLWTAGVIRLGPGRWWGDFAAAQPGHSLTLLIGHGVLIAACVWCGQSGPPGWRRATLFVIAGLTLAHAFLPA